MKKFLMRAGVLGVTSLPFVALAQGFNPQYPASFITGLQSLINLAFPVVFAAAVLGFMVGVGMYLFSGGDDGQKDKAKDVMKWGLIVLFVMFALYGILKLVSGVLNIDLGGSINSPRIPN